MYPSYTCLHSVSGAPTINRGEALPGTAGSGEREDEPLNGDLSLIKPIASEPSPELSEAVPRRSCVLSLLRVSTANSLVRQMVNLLSLILRARQLKGHYSRECQDKNVGQWSIIKMDPFLFIRSVQLKSTTHCTHLAILIFPSFLFCLYFSLCGTILKGYMDRYL